MAHLSDVTGDSATPCVPIEAPGSSQYTPQHLNLNLLDSRESEKPEWVVCPVLEA